MLHYTNIISDPFPDVVDPVTGDWLPKSYNDVKADALKRAQDAVLNSDMVVVASMLSSILK